MQQIDRAGRPGEGAIVWGVHAAQGSEEDATGRKPTCQDRTACSERPIQHRARTVRNRCTVSRFHRICCRLIIRLATIAFTADSAKAVEIGAPAR